jgi:AhpD family alkylhydroperoxidase
MTRIAPVAIDTAPAAAAEGLVATRAMFGRIPNMFATAAQSPAALTAMNGFFAALSSGVIGGRVGEQVAIAIAEANACEYCLAAHTAIGGLHKVPITDLAAARVGRSSDPRAHAAITFALDVLHARGRVDDSAIAAARAAGLGDGEFVELVAHVALNVFTNSLNNLAQTEVDFPRVPELAAA